MVYATITNATFDVAAAAVPAPYGPLTRVDDLESTPTYSPNSHIGVRVTSAAGVAFEISYADLTASNVVRDQYIKEAHGVQGKLQDLADWAAQLNAVLNNTAFDPLAAPDHFWQWILKAFQAMPEICALAPFEAFDEVQDRTTEMVASIATATVALVVTITNNSTGLYHFALIDWDDGTWDLIGMDTTSIAHTYSAGSYDPVLWIIGPQGIDSDTDNVTPA